MLLTWGWGTHSLNLNISEDDLMHPLARKHFKKVLHSYRTLGAIRDCEYYPCHPDLEDCTWCFCPFYPCEDESTGGRWFRRGKREVWSCASCHWVHNPETAAKILEKLKALNINSIEDLETRQSEIRSVRGDI